MSAATILSAPGFADSTNDALNGQVFLGDFDGRLNVVVDVADQANAGAIAMGNAVSAYSGADDVALESTQALAGDGAAVATVTGETVWDATVAATGFGNALAVEGDGASLSALGDQAYANGALSSEAVLEVDRAGSAAVVASTVANAASATARDGEVTAFFDQDNAAQNTAAAEAIVGDADALSVTALSVANTVTASADYGALDVSAVQANSGDPVQATTFVDAGAVTALSAASTAGGNSLYATNVGPSGAIGGYQENTGYVRGETSVSLGGFDEAAVSATAMGSSALLNTVGGDVSIALTQNNWSGGVEADARFTAAGGGDAFAASAAFGNTVTATSCSVCARPFQGETRQLSEGPVRSQTTISVGGQAGSVAGSAVAVGNNASFSSAIPGGG